MPGNLAAVGNHGNGFKSVCVGECELQSKKGETPSRMAQCGKLLILKEGETPVEETTAEAVQDCGQTLGA